MDDNRPPTAKTARVFVGLKIAPEIAEKLAQLAQDLEDFPTRFVPSEDIHLTLVPPWNESSIPDAIEKLSKALKGSTPFTLTFARVAYWPNRRHPRLLSVECLATPEIRALHSALLDAFGQTEDRPFEPHVTLARLKSDGRAAARENEMDRALSLAQSIDSVELFQSRTQAGKGYEVLASIPLTAPRRNWRDFLRQATDQVVRIWHRIASKRNSESSRSGGGSNVATIDRKASTADCRSGQGSAYGSRAASTIPLQLLRLALYRLTIPPSPCCNK